VVRVSPPPEGVDLAPEVLVKEMSAAKGVEKAMRVSPTARAEPMVYLPSEIPVVWVFAD
jgi:hypothetical protein